MSITAAVFVLSESSLQHFFRPLQIIPPLHSTVNLITLVKLLTPDSRAAALSPAGEQHMYKCLSCPFSSMTIIQLKEHSLREHGEALTLHKLRAATQAAQATHRPVRPATDAEQSPLATDGK